MGILKNFISFLVERFTTAREFYDHQEQLAFQQSQEQKTEQYKHPIRWSS